MMCGTLKWPLTLFHWVWHDGTILQTKSWVRDVKRWTWFQILTSHTTKSRACIVPRPTWLPSLCSLPCSARILIKAVCSWIVGIEVSSMYMCTVACTCVHMFVQGRRSHWVPSSLLSILFFGGCCRLSHQQTPAALLLCLHNTVTTAVQLHQLLGSGRLNSDPMSTHLILYEPSHHASSMF